MSAFNKDPACHDATVPHNDPVSPCVSICALDGDDICVGCFRTGREISYWGLLPVEDRREVLVRCQRRMAGEPAPCMVTPDQP